MEPIGAVHARVLDARHTPRAVCYARCSRAADEHRQRYTVGVYLELIYSPVLSREDRCRQQSRPRTAGDIEMRVLDVRVRHGEEGVLRSSRAPLQEHVVEVQISQNHAYPRRLRVHDRGAEGAAPVEIGIAERYLAECRWIVVVVKDDRRAQSKGGGIKNDLGF